MKHLYTADDMLHHGVYAIFRNDEIYIGSTAKSYRSRLRKHICDLEANRHGNPRLQNIYNKHGDIFEFRIIEVCDNTIQAEQKWIDHYILVDRDKLLNAQVVAGFSSLGMKRSAKTKARMSQALTGRKMSDEAKAAMSEAAKKPHRLAQFEALRHDPVIKAKVSASISKSLTGKKQSEEVKNKKSVAMRGKNSKLTDAQIAEMKVILSTTKKTRKEIGAIFGVSSGTVNYVVNGSRGQSIRSDLNDLIPKGQSVGSRNGGSILTSEDVIKITQLLKSGLRPKEICGSFNVHAGSIDQINRGRIWVSVTVGNSYPINGKRKLTPEETESAVQKLKDGVGSSAIARMFNVSSTAISNLKKKRGIV